MYALLKLSNNDDYFKTISQRGSAGVYFCRYPGFDDNTLLFLGKLVRSLTDRGVYVTKPMKNPVEQEISYLYKAVGTQDFEFSKGFIEKAVDSWFRGTDERCLNLLSAGIYSMLEEMAAMHTSVNILKNAYVKFMCWSRQVFGKVIPMLGADSPPKILYDGEISKYEVYMLHIMNLAGCDIAYVCFQGDESYLKHDSPSKYSQLITGLKPGNPRIHYATMDVESHENETKRKTAVKESLQYINTNASLSGTLMEEILKPHSIRNRVSLDKIYNVYGLIAGCDNREEYARSIFSFRKAVLDNKKPLHLAESSFHNPTLDEVKEIGPFNYTNKQELVTKLAMKVNLFADKKLNAVAQTALVTAMENKEEQILSKLYNFGMKLLCWLRRDVAPLCHSFDKENLPVFLFFGNCSKSDGEFLRILSYMPVDVLIISPDQQVKTVFEGDDRIIVETLSGSMAVFPFPKTEPKAKVATAAYQAERELDTILYQDTGLFRNKQFTRSKPVTLKTTYDEIKILWRQEAKYRPGFETEKGQVSVPNIFAKICGVENGDSTAYFQGIEQLLTVNTLLITMIPFLAPGASNPISAYVQKFIEKGEILPDVIKKHRSYPYEHLSENVQNYILEKMQQMISLNWIKTDTPGVEYAILRTILSLDKIVLQLIQKFDFTKEIPKIVIVDTDESLFSLEECIYILFLNLVGFDIVVFTPTGYRNLEKYITEEAFVEHQIGNYMFHLTVPAMRILPQTETRPQKEKGLFSKILKRR